MTVPSTEKPARLYVGLAAPGKGPKLIFLRALTTLLAAAQKEAQAGGDARPLPDRALLLQRAARTRRRAPHRRGRSDARSSRPTATSGAASSRSTSPSRTDACAKSWS